MAHRLLHSLVFSSVVLLEGVGCSVSHGRREPPPPLPDAGPGGDGGPPPDDAAPPVLDAGWFDDAGQLRDSGAIWDAHMATDGGTDAGLDGGADAGSDAGLDGGAGSDAGPPDDAGPMQVCVPGWPTTKGFWCVVENDTRICCNSWSDPGTINDECCVAEAP